MNKKGSYLGKPAACVRILAQIILCGPRERPACRRSPSPAMISSNRPRMPLSRTVPPQRATEKNERKNSPCSENDAPSGEESTVRDSQDRSPPGRSCLCRPVVPANESLRDKFTRIFFGPDWCGPDPDVDTSISAGGSSWTLALF